MGHYFLDLRHFILQLTKDIDYDEGKMMSQIKYPDEFLNEAA